MNGAIAMTEGLVDKLKKEVFTGKEVTVIAAGGFAKLFEDRTKAIDHIAPHLVLEGIALVCK
jgi:pantothenate kinase type III